MCLAYGILEISICKYKALFVNNIIEAVYRKINLNILKLNIGFGNLKSYLDDLIEFNLIFIFLIDN